LNFSDVLRTQRVLHLRGPGKADDGHRRMVAALKLCVDRMAGLQKRQQGCPDAEPEMAVAMSGVVLVECTGMEAPDGGVE
jgi:hypothetical protein